MSRNHRSREQFFKYDRHKFHINTKHRIVREELYPLNGQIVLCSADPVKRTKHHLLVENVLVNQSIFIDHMWIAIEDFKLDQNTKSKRIYFQAQVYKYKSSHKHNTKMGLRNIKYLNKQQFKEEICNQNH